MKVNVLSLYLHLKTKVMKIYNEIKSAILKINKTVQPVKIKKHNIVHSDGLTQTHQEHVYGEPISSIRKAIWNSKLTAKQKLELNEVLVSKIKI